MSSGWQRPGRLVAAAALVVFVLGVLATGVRIARHQSPPLLATNGVGVGAVITALPRPGDELCLARTPVPAGTRAIQLWLGWHVVRPVDVHGTLALTGGRVIELQRTAVAPTAGYVTVPLAAAVPRDAIGTLCVTRGAGAGVLDVGGASVIRAPGEVPATNDGTPLGQVEPSLRMLSRADGRWSSSLGLVDDAVTRLAHLSPSPLGAAGIAVCLFVLVPGALFLLVWNLATAPRRSRRRVAALCALGSLAIAASWATVTPAFQGPDESEHFAYAQYLAATGHHPQSRAGLPDARPPYSTQQSAALALLRNNAVVIDPAARQPWTALTRDELAATDHLPQDDGGGFTESASAHSALYYVLVAPAMHLGGDSILLQLWLARLTTALLGGLLAALAAWAAGILVPGRPRVAALTGLAAATIPMAGAVAGDVNNDALLNLVAAAGFTVVLSLLVRPAGELRRYAAAGALIAVLPVAKIAGAGIGMALAVGALLAVVRVRPARAAVRAALSGVAGAVAVLAVLAAAAVLLVGGQALTLVNVHPAAIGAAPGAPGATLTQHLEYIAQSLVPVVHLGGTDLFPGTTPYEDVYVRGLWGGFGWNRLSPPGAVLGGVTIAVMLGALAGFAALLREREHWRGRRLAVLAVAFTPFAVIAFVAWAYTSAGPRTTYGEQGRYLLPALVPISLWFAAIPGAVPAGRGRSLLTGALAGGMCALVVVGLASAVGGWTT